MLLKLNNPTITFNYDNIYNTICAIKTDNTDINVVPMGFIYNTICAIKTLKAILTSVMNNIFTIQFVLLK